MNNNHLPHRPSAFERFKQGMVQKTVETFSNQRNQIIAMAAAIGLSFASVNMVNKHAESAKTNFSKSGVFVENINSTYKNKNEFTDLMVNPDTRHITDVVRNALLNGNTNLNTTPRFGIKNNFSTETIEQITELANKHFLTYRENNDYTFQQALLGAVSLAMEQVAGVSFEAQNQGYLGVWRMGMENPSWGPARANIEHNRLQRLKNRQFPTPPATAPSRQHKPERLNFLRNAKVEIQDKFKSFYERVRNV